MATVYSYLRFSDKKQAQGDSVKRQTRMREDWLAHHPEHTLDDTLSLRDMGVSAFRGSNLDKDKADLGQFIHLAKQGQIEAGSILLLERLDRFSRLPPRKVYGIFCELIDCGIAIETLDPPQTIDTSNVDDMASVISTIVFMQIAFEQSREKRKRVGNVWRSKREEARKNNTPMFARGPSWLEYDKDANKFRVKPGAAKAIRFIFTQTVKEVGQRALTAQLNAKFPPLGRSGKWNSSYVQKVLNDRAILGELQPYRFTDTGERVPDGKPIVNYYPRIIPDKLFYQAQASKETRFKTKAAKRPFVNLFTSLLYGSDGYPRHIQTARGAVRQKDGVRYIQRRLVSWGHWRGLPNSCPLSYDYHKLEEAVLRVLWELKEELPPEKDILATKEAELQAIDERMEALGEELSRISKPLPQVLNAIRDLEERRERVRQEIGHVQTCGVHPVKDAKDLLTMLDKAPDKDKHNIRLHLWRVICGIVKRITITCIKLPKRHVGARIDIELHTGETRIVCQAGKLIAESTPNGFVMLGSMKDAPMLAHFDKAQQDEFMGIFGKHIEAIVPLVAHVPLQ